jgi:V8-like Glu-specific endopeptidase
MDKANPQWKKVSVSDLEIFPYNCIGSLKTITANEEDLPNLGTGFLISPNLVLTAAHTFQKVKFGEVIELVPDSFPMEGKAIRIKDFQINRRYVESAIEVAILENESEEATKVRKKQIK